MPAVLVDTGPLVALLDRSDPDHVACQETLSSLNDSMVTVWPVITEAMYMLRAYWQAQEALWEMIEMGAVEILPLGFDDVPRMKEFDAQVSRSADGPGRRRSRARRRARTVASNLYPRPP